jgi:predicted nucleotidyltransferase
MLDPDFIIPKVRIAETETKKRIRIIEEILPELMKYSSAILLTGSMAYGQDFSVTPESDIDIQILTNPEKISKI